MARKRSSHRHDEHASAVEVSLLFACDMVQDNDSVLRRALADILSVNPGELVGDPEISEAPRARTSTVAVTIRVRDRHDALRFQQRGELILEHYGLRPSG